MGVELCSRDIGHEDGPSGMHVVGEFLLPCAARGNDLRVACQKGFSGVYGCALHRSDVKSFEAVGMRCVHHSVSRAVADGETHVDSSETGVGVDDVGLPCDDQGADGSETGEVSVGQSMNLQELLVRCVEVTT